VGTAAIDLIVFTSLKSPESLQKPRTVTTTGCKGELWVEVAIIFFPAMSKGEAVYKKIYVAKENWVYLSFRA